MYRLLVSTLSLLVLGCTDQSLGTRSLEHPYADTASVDLIAARTPGTEWGTLAPAVKAIADIRPVFTVGSFNGPPETLWGNIVAADFADNGDLLVLDAQANELRRFAPDGTYIDTYGGTGDGPLEMRNPVSIDYVGGDTIALTSRSGVAFWSLDGEPTNLRSTQGSGLPSPRDACAIGHKVYVHGWQRDAGHTLHSIALDAGLPMQSFGVGYESGSQITQQKLSTGKVACLERSDAVALGFSNRGVLAVYTGAGVPLWTARLPDFVSAPVVESVDSEGRTVVTEDFSLAHDVLLGMAAFQDSLLVVQVARIQPLEEGVQAQPVTELHSWLIDPRNRKSAYIGSGLPLIMAEDDGLIAALPVPKDSSDIVPRIAVYTIQGGAE